MKEIFDLFLTKSVLFKELEINGWISSNGQRNANPLLMTVWTPRGAQAKASTLECPVDFTRLVVSGHYPSVY